MKTKTAARIVVLPLLVSLFAAAPLMAAGDSCFVTPRMEKTRVVVREVDQGGNPQGQIGSSNWLSLGERLPITSQTEKIVISYQETSEGRSYRTGAQDCSNGRVIYVP